MGGRGLLVQLCVAELTGCLGRRRRPTGLFPDLTCVSGRKSCVLNHVCVCLCPSLCCHVRPGSGQQSLYKHPQVCQGSSLPRLRERVAAVQRSDLTALCCFIYGGDVDAGMFIKDSLIMWDKVRCSGWKFEKALKIVKEKRTPTCFGPLSSELRRGREMMHILITWIINGK